MILERDIEKYLKDEVEKRGGMVIKQVGIDGIPDRLVLAPLGQSCFVELKRPGGKPRKLQIHRISQLKALGQEAVVVDSKEQVEELIRKIF